MNVQTLVSEMIELLPEFRGREEELKKMIETLLGSRPDVEMNEDFKEELRQEILFAAEKEKRRRRRKNLLAVIPSAAAASLLLIVGLNTFNTLKRGPESAGSEPTLFDFTGGSQEPERETLMEEDSDDFESGLVSPAVTEFRELKVADGRVEETAARGFVPSRPADQEGHTQPQYDELVQLEEEITAGDVQRDEFNTEEYTPIYENDFFSALSDPLSTFSIDVDTASYSNTRRYLMGGGLPPADAVRIEELVNYFDYDYPQVTGEHPFEFHTALSSCPWNEEHQLLYLGIQGARKDFEVLPPNNLVFLLDVSGSMNDSNKLPLLKQSLGMLTRQLRPQDSVAIVVYAGAAGVVLEPTQGNRTQRIIDAFDHLQAGGSTAGGEGIALAYKLAEESFMEQGNNRIILATDGDFNVGSSSTAETTRLIEENRDKGIYLTVLGFGMGNYKDSRMEQMADRGNGNYAYIDTLLEAKKVLVNEISSTLFTIASDVKIQIEFNPYLVSQYRLVGYENRVMENQDFDNDKKDAGELGAGHSVTAIYEIIPAGKSQGDSDDLRYQDQTLSEQAENGEVMTIKFRYKRPDVTQSTLIVQPVPYELQRFEEMDGAWQFAAAVAQWGMLLRNSRYSGTGSYQWVLDTARGADVVDPYGLKGEFLNLVELSQVLGE